MKESEDFNVKNVETITKELAILKGIKSCVLTWTQQNVICVTNVSMGRKGSKYTEEDFMVACTSVLSVLNRFLELLFLLHIES